MDIIDTNIPTELFGTTVSCDGQVVDQADVRDFYTYIIIHLEGECGGVRVKTLVSHFPEYQYGDLLHFEGELERPEDFETDTGRVFRYEAFLAKDGITALSYYPEVTKLGEPRFNFRRILFSLKTFFTNGINTMLPSPHAELLGGLLVGAKQSLGAKLLEDFRIVGLIHIVVLSGFNVVIIIQFFSAILSWLPKKVSLSVSALLIISFTLMVGLEPPIVRASIMALIALWGMSSYRTYDIHRAFALTLTLMIAQNPHILLDDPSFQLSGLATAGLIYIAPIVERGFGWLTKKFGIQEIVVSTISTYIAVLPFLVYLMGDLSVVSLVVNLLVLPIIPITMLFGFLGYLSFSLFYISFPFVYLTYFLLEYELFIVETFAKLPFAILETPAIPLFVVIVLYVLMTVGIVYCGSRLGKKI